MADVTDERDRLHKALAALNGTAAKKVAPRRRRASTEGSKARAPRRRSDKRAPRGARQQQFLELLRKSPQLPLPQMAKTMGVPATQLYPLAKRLAAAGKIERAEPGYQLVSKS